ncbi:hypothetical protein BGZ83_010936, partial [Gryganskiella cystojenkinii]
MLLLGFFWMIQLSAFAARSVIEGTSLLTSPGLPPSPLVSDTGAQVQGEAVSVMSSSSSSLWLSYNSATDLVMDPKDPRLYFFGTKNQTDLSEFLYLQKRWNNNNFSGNNAGSIAPVRGSYYTSCQVCWSFCARHCDSACCYQWCDHNWSTWTLGTPYPFLVGGPGNGGGEKNVGGGGPAARCGYGDGATYGGGGGVGGGVGYGGGYTEDGGWGVCCDTPCTNQPPHHQCNVATPQMARPWSWLDAAMTDRFGGQDDTRREEGPSSLVNLKS